MKYLRFGMAQCVKCLGVFGYLDDDVCQQCWDNIKEEKLDIARETLGEKTERYASDGYMGFQVSEDQAYEFAQEDRKYYQRQNRL
jgi:hypothetical protein